MEDYKSDTASDIILSQRTVFGQTSQKSDWIPVFFIIQTETIFRFSYFALTILTKWLLAAIARSSHFYHANMLILESLFQQIDLHSCVNLMIQAFYQFCANLSTFLYRKIIIRLYLPYYFALVLGLRLMTMREPVFCFTSSTNSVIYSLK